MNRVLLSGRLTKDAQISTYGENNEKKMVIRLKTKFRTMLPQ